MDDKQRLNLQEMVNASDAENNTSKIRNLKHSKLIQSDVEQLLNLKKKYKRMSLTNPAKYESIICKHCNFLFTNYTNIFNRLMKDELDLKILMVFINTLKDVEKGHLDQHEASVKIGEILKKLYIDSALKREEKINEKSEKSEPKYKKPLNNISWEKFKQAGLNL
jgi:RNase P subunit RPR2